MSKRVSLILKDRDEETIAPYLTEGSAAHAALSTWATGRGLGAVTSEASGLRALLAAGAEALSELALDAGYASLAEEFNAPEADVERREARRRYVDRARP
ncbi:MAG: hypothetical protein QM774_01080 [Gordonia sp. (in: high G+C Gram-positive bacteria)]|uniref:hypothetical protein n=1 Tax=Gordonia sp. (in: high G+C Gram-positive bacteria) TaxID=84139 RepID=UPI0039E57426